MIALFSYCIYPFDIALYRSRDFASAEATRGLSGRPLDPFGSPLLELTFSADEGIAPAGATRGLSDRPLDPFGYSAFIVKVNV
jgi:hypothetical protein